MTRVRKMRHSSRGFTLVEVLIALVVLSISLLGLAALQTSALKFNHSGYQRSQATLLAYDILDRMRANRTKAMSSSTYNIDTTASTPSAGTNCNSTNCTDSQLAAFDIYQWRTALTQTLPNGTGGVSYVDIGTTRLYTIEVRWSDISWDNTQNAKEGLVRADQTITVRSEI